MLRGAGLMSQASGLGPASARTTTGAPAKVRLCSRRSCFCPLHETAFIAAQCTLSVSPLAPGKASSCLFCAIRTIWHVLYGNNVVE